MNYFGKFIEIKILQSVDAGVGVRGGGGAEAPLSPRKGGLAPLKLTKCLWRERGLKYTISFDYKYLNTEIYVVFGLC